MQVTARHTLCFSLCHFGAQAPDGLVVRSSSLVFYFVVQDVVEIIQEYFLRPQVRSQEKAGAVARYVRLHAVDAQERSRLRILLESRSRLLLYCSAWSRISARAAPAFNFLFIRVEY